MKPRLEKEMKEKMWELIKLFKEWYSDRDACYYAWINLTALNTYCKENPWFREIKNILKKTWK